MLRAKLKQHILDICRQQEIQVEWRRSSRGGWAVPNSSLSAFRPSRVRSRAHPRK